MTRSRLVIPNTIIIWLCQLFALGPQLVVVPYLLSTLGESGFGVYTVIWSLITAIDRFERSLQSGVVKYGAEHLGKNTLSPISSILSCGFWCAVLVGAVATTAILLATSFTEHLIPGIRPPLLVVAATVFLISPTAPFLALIHSRQHYYITAVADLLAQYAALSTILALFFFFKPSPTIAVIAMSTTLLVSRLAQLPCTYFLIPGLTRHFLSLDRRTLRAIISFGSATVLLAGCGIANASGMKWLLTVLISTTFVAHLGIALTPSLLLSRLASALTVTLMPASSDCHARRDLPALQRLLLSGIRNSTHFVLTGNLLAIPLIPLAFEIWVGREYRFLAPYAIGLLLGHSFFLSTSPAHHIMKGLGRLRETVLIHFTVLVAIPVLVFTLLHRVGTDPYLAVTLSLTSGHCIGSFLNLARGANATGLRLTTLLNRAYVQPLVPALLSTGPSLIIANLKTETPLGIILAALSSVAFFEATWCLAIASLEEKQRIRRLAKATFSRAPLPFRILLLHPITKPPEYPRVKNNPYTRKDFT